MEEFDFSMAPSAPLAELLRPKTLDEVVGQESLLGEDGRLRLMLAHGNLGSVILWGPPGTGKTTIARLLAETADMFFEPVSAVLTGWLNCAKFLFVPKNDERPERVHYCLWTKCIDLIKPSKMGCCRGLRMAL